MPTCIPSKMQLGFNKIKVFFFVTGEKSFNKVGYLCLTSLLTLSNVDVWGQEPDLNNDANVLLLQLVVLATSPYLS
jgi:hypothetical protein